MNIDKLLKQYGLKYEDLNEGELASLHGMIESMNQGTLTVEKIREHITACRISVDTELSKFDTGGKQDIFLKARLRNYVLLEAFLISPEKAKKALEEAVSRLG